MNNNKTENKTEDHTQNLSEELKNMLVKDLKQKTIKEQLGGHEL